MDNVSNDVLDYAPDTEILKKKRGRKKKSETLAENPPTITTSVNITMEIEDSTDSTNSAGRLHSVPSVPCPAKKRGRKPKGGKLVLKQVDTLDSDSPIANIILHLKCSVQDLNEYNTQMNKIVTDPLTYNPIVPPTIMTYNSNDGVSFSKYEQSISNSLEKPNDAYNEFEHSKLCSVCHSKKIGIDTAGQDGEVGKNNVEGHEILIDDTADISVKDVNQKLKKIKLQLYKNTNPDKKSACFWCTYEYDNPSCYIPKYEMDGQLYGYGSFCRPECAVAYLMKENVDDSTKFERYHLLNQMYSKIYDYKRNIKPAPNPYFLLDKFYGNLSIQEYRKLLKTEHMLLIIEKPMTRILPELHEDNEDFIMNIYGTKQGVGQKCGEKGTGQSGGVYKVKRQSEKQKGPSKTSIMKESFGLT
uniref:MYM-type domain-containing protein n=1 Tax=viral metagenome TaxID=1070528 RepID=A0A6C0JHB7_9ZZZZ